MSKIFDITMGGVYDGLQVAANGSTIEPGLLVQYDTGGSTAALATAASASGFAWGSRYRPYTPTTAVFADGEPITVVYGVGQAIASADFFTGGTLPAVGSDLYAAASGLMDTSGSQKVGYVKNTDNVIEPTGGTGTTTAVAVIAFNIVP